MLLTAFIVLQVILDLEVVVYFLMRMRRRKAAKPPVEPEPPAWYRDFLVLAEDLLTLIEPVLDHLEKTPAAPAPAGAAADTAAASAPSPAAAAPTPEPKSLRERHREAFALLRAGASPDDVARREGLGTGELRLLKNLVAAEAQIRVAPGS
jgi:hypothetical protein